MRVEHVPGGGSAAHAFLQLDDFLVVAFPRRFDAFFLFLSLTLSLLAIQDYRLQGYNSQQYSMILASLRIE